MKQNILSFVAGLIMIGIGNNGKTQTNYIQSTGYVGLGTGSSSSNPIRLLHLASPVAKTNTSPQYMFFQSSNEIGVGAKPFGMVTSIVGGYAMSNRSCVMETTTHGDSSGGNIILQPNLGQRVGIGTLTPDADYKLSVAGSIHVSGGTLRNDLGSNGFSLILNGSGSNLHFNHDATPFTNIYNSGGGIKFQNSSHSATLLVIDNFGTGGVGICTDSIGTYKLAVGGDIRAKRLVVEAGWYDHVFNSDYQLRSIYELESFIRLKKHLPDMPTAEEVKENGVSVGENQALLLKKIEELTLYVIAQQKEIDKLKKKRN